MRHRIPPEIERLMWLVADENDPRAIADFERRFPEYRMDLARHMAMVSGLKGAKKKLVPAREVPRFQPSRAPKPQPINRGVYLLAAVMLAAIGVASFKITAGNSASMPKIDVPIANVGPVTPPDNVQAVRKPIEKTPIIAEQNEPKPAPELQVDDPLVRPITLRVESAPLSAALVMVGQQAKIKIEVAPGLADQDVQLDYAGVPAVQVLEDLGARYGFTAMPQEKGNVLIVPVRPEDGSETPATDPEKQGIRIAKSPNPGGQ